MNTSKLIVIIAIFAGLIIIGLLSYFAFFNNPSSIEEMNNQDPQIEQQLI